VNVVALTLPALMLPVTESEPSVPTVVKLDVVIPDARVVPVRFAALAVIATLAAADNCPCPLTVNDATLSPLP
jgi:hypothetical protein